MEDKVVNLNFYQLCPLSEDSDERKAQEKEIKEIFTNPNTYRTLIRTDSHVSIYGDMRKKDGLYFGTLVNNQTSDIPPGFDESTGKVEPLALGQNQGLGYSTSFIFDPENRIVMIESVRNGVSIGAFCRFLQFNLNIPDFEPALVIDPAELERFYSFSSITKFHVKIARLEHGSIFSGRKKSIKQLTDSADNTNTDTLEYSLSVRKRSDSLALAKVRGLVKDLLKFKDTDEVQKLDVIGKAGEDAPPEAIDFIKQRLRERIMVTKERLVTSFQIEERYDLLTTAYNKHRKGLKVYSLKRV